MKILPSVASDNQLCLGKEIEALGGHKYLHFDIEDGNFVPNITFGMKTIRAVVSKYDKIWDAHLMVTNPLMYIEELGEAGCSAAAFHWESTGYPLQVIHKIKRMGMKAGIALNPNTPANVLKPYLDRLDYILIMTSEPDGEGDLFQNEMIKKVECLARLCGPQTEIIADGGIAEKEFLCLKKAGATGAVMGRTIFASEHPCDTIETFSNLYPGTHHSTCPGH